MSRGSQRSQVVQQAQDSQLPMIGMRQMQQVLGSNTPQVHLIKKQPIVD